MQQKKEFKLRKCLEMLTMDEMHEIRKSLKIRNASKLRRDNLIDKLATDIPEYIEDMFLLFDQHRYKIVKTFIKNKGVILFDSIDEGLDFDDYYFLNNGIIYNGFHNEKFAFVMPQEIMDKFKRIDNKDYKNIVKRNSDWIMYLHGLVYYYGAIADKSAMALIEEAFDNIDNNLASFYNVIHEGLYYYQVIEMYYKNRQLFYFNAAYEDGAIILEEHEKRKSIGFYPYSKKQFIQAGYPYYYEQTPETKQLKDFLNKYYKLDEATINALVGDCTEIIRLSCNENNLSDIFDFFNQTIGITSLERAQELGDIIVAINNNYPMCALKGHTPVSFRQVISSDKDMSQNNTFQEETTNIYSFQTGKKIERNDPCPCGSGLKFKKCCGKK